MGSPEARGASGVSLRAGVLLISGNSGEDEAPLVCASILLLLHDFLSTVLRTAGPPPSQGKSIRQPTSGDRWLSVRLQIRLQPPEGGPALWPSLKDPVLQDVAKWPPARDGPRCPMALPFVTLCHQLTPSGLKTSNCRRSTHGQTWCLVLQG